MNKKQIFILVLLSSLSLQVFSQRSEGREKIEAAKIGLISERLGLTPDEAERFWPLYNEYTRKREENHRAFKEARRSFNPEEATEEETLQMLELGKETKQKQLELEQDYSERLLNVISTRQLLSLQEAERDFRKMLLNRLENRRASDNGQNEIRRENYERLRNKRNN